VAFPTSISTADKIFLSVFDIIARTFSLIRRVPYGNEVVNKIVSSPQFKQIFDEADVHSKGSLGEEEVYTLVLRFYILVAQYTLVVARHIPSREDVSNIVSNGDFNKDGGITFNEFKGLILMLCEGVATQLAAQILFTVLLSPLLALSFIFILKYSVAFFPLLLGQFWFIPSFLRNDKIGLLVFVPLFNFLVMPYYLEYVFYIQSLRNPEKVRFVPDMSQFQSLPSPLESLKEITEELTERAERMEGKSDESDSDSANHENDLKEEGIKSANDNENITHSTYSGSSEDDLVILEKDCVSKKDD
jgi:hypothetical protein